MYVKNYKWKILYAFCILIKKIISYEHFFLNQATLFNYECCELILQSYLPINEKLMCYVNLKL